MNWKRSIFLLLGVSLLLALAACSGGGPRVDWEVSITGDVEAPQTYTFKELAGLEQVELRGDDGKVDRRR